MKVLLGKSLKFILNFLLVSYTLLAIILVGNVIYSFFTHGFDFNTLSTFLVVEFYLFIYITISKNILFIINSSKTTPFIKDNVKKFNTIGYCLLLISIMEGINSYSYSENYLSISRIFTVEGKGAITMPIIALFLCGIVCFFIGEVFDKAIKIKEDNDLMI